MLSMSHTLRLHVRILLAENYDRTLTNNTFLRESINSRKTGINIESEALARRPITT